MEALQVRGLALHEPEHRERIHPSAAHKHHACRRRHSFLGKTLGSPPSLRGTVHCSSPSYHLEEFSGALELDGQGKRLPVDDVNLVIRGTHLRNTDWLVGLIVYTGFKTKLALNSSAPPSKYSACNPCNRSKHKHRCNATAPSSVRSVDSKDPCNPCTILAILASPANCCNPSNGSIVGGSNKYSNTLGGKIKTVEEEFCGDVRSRQSLV